MSEPTARSGRKGGTQYPRISLKKAVEYSVKLVSKTHTGPQPASIILKGVFNNSTGPGKVRASALKQYELLQGESAAYDATPLAKAINSAPPEERTPLLRKACLFPKLFKRLYDTFQNDTVSKAKIRQQALTLDVHPENGDEAVNIFVESLVYAKLAVERNGEFEITRVTAVAKSESSNQQSMNPESALPTAGLESDGVEEGDGDPDDGREEQREETTGEKPTKSSRGRSQIQIALTLDSTMDPEKLEKYMKILTRYGAIG